MDKKVNYHIINSFMNKGTSKIDFGQEDYFLVFNYTHTLQKIYNISEHRIHYLHGECMEDDD
ncbi:hypothetical protein GCM10008906_22200 [Clostridium oceanicum]|uniref:Uncharacterized protein n=1 Tax=Clostridium oceanicum TaxID=1543 RepID=A0ABN1JJR6_9CLOT